MKKTLESLLVIIIIGVAIIGSVDLLVVSMTRVMIYDNPAQIEEMSDFTSPESGGVDCILILGCGVHADGTPSAMLQDRLDTGINLYNAGFAPRILISGDNGQITYNEIHVMLHYLLDRGIPAADIFCDHAGFSTYDSIHRSNSIFGVQRMIIVTQRYHQYRAQFIASRLGIASIGCCTDDIRYRGWVYREIREIAARDKDCIKSMLRLHPKYGGDPISLDGDSTLSWEASELE